jgi:hypothetical protein
MNEQQKHEMIINGTLPSGAEEWFCPVCGRRTLINWEPEFKRTVLETGDSLAVHTAIKSSLPAESLQLDASASSFPQEGEQASGEDYRLAPWLDWLNKVDFNRLWKDDIQ